MSASGLRDPLRAFALPRAPGALRVRVLERALEAARSSPVPSRTDRIWFSRRWRLTWAAALVASVMVDVVASRAGGVAPARLEDRSAHRGEVEGEGNAAAAEMDLPPRSWPGEEIVTGEPSPRDRVMTWKQSSPWTMEATL